MSRSTLALALVWAVALVGQVVNAADQPQPDQLKVVGPDQVKPDQVKVVKPDQVKPDQVKIVKPDQVKPDQVKSGKYRHTLFTKNGRRHHHVVVFKHSRLRFHKV